jgi:hypothetical protein
MISERWTGKDVEGSGSDLACGSILEFAQKDRGKPRKALGRIVCDSDEIKTEQPPNFGFQF